MCKIGRGVTLAVLLVAVCFSISSTTEAAIPANERQIILREVLDDATKITQASSRLSEALLEFVNGNTSETDMFHTAILLFQEAKSLETKAKDRFNWFIEEYPLETYTTNDELNTLGIVMASLSQSSSFFRATMMAVERFKPRDEELSDGDKRAFEELITVHNELASVYSTLINMYINK